MHAAVRIGAGKTARLERLIRYIARPAFAQDRLSVARYGSIVYRFRKPWRNGKQAVVMDPMTFLSRLSAQIPPPRFHALSYFGVLAAAASRLDEIVPGHEVDDDAEPGRCCASSPDADVVTSVAGTAWSSGAAPKGCHGPSWCSGCSSKMSCAVNAVGSAGFWR